MLPTASLWMSTHGLNYLCHEILICYQSIRNNYFALRDLDVLSSHQPRLRMMTMR